MRVIAVAHDPGGASAVAAVVAALRRAGAGVDAYAKGPADRQFHQLGVACSKVPADHGPLVNASQGDLLLMGTSRYDGFEREVLRWAQVRRIPSVALIDYWANYRMRFGSPAGAEAKPVLPAALVAIDESCARGMIAEGLPADRIRVLGQPYFAWLLKQRTVQAKRPMPPRKILFASQPEANEIEILETLLAALADHTPLDLLTVRFHPRQVDIASSLELLEASRLPYTVDTCDNSIESLCRQDMVFGITSTLLIESALLGVPTGSLVIGTPDTLLTNQRQLTTPLTTLDALRAFLISERPAATNAAFEAWHRDADLRISDLCFELATGKAHLDLSRHGTGSEGVNHGI